MTLDEAIKHCEEVAEQQEQYAKGYAQGDAIEVYDAFDCDECAEEHRQLAEWLKELKAYKEQPSTEGSCPSTNSSTTPARARGKWMTEHNRGYVQCSNCHNRVPFCKRSNFCPNCGADMRGEEITDDT